MGNECHTSWPGGPSAPPTAPSITIPSRTAKGGKKSEKKGKGIRDGNTGEIE